MLLCEAAGFDVVLVETVGIGQSETAVCDMTDFFLALMLPGAGDELQGIKKGLVELADMIAVNKADGDNIKRANLAASEYRGALHILRRVRRLLDAAGSDLFGLDRYERRRMCGRNSRSSRRRGCVGRSSRHGGGTAGEVDVVAAGTADDGAARADPAVRAKVEKSRSEVADGPLRRRSGRRARGHFEVNER